MKKSPFEEKRDMSKSLRKCNDTLLRLNREKADKIRELEDLIATKNDAIFTLRRMVFEQAKKKNEATSERDRLAYLVEKNKEIM